MSESEDIKGNESSKIFLAGTYVTAIFTPFFFIMFRKCKMGYTYENWYFKKCSKIIKVLFIIQSEPGSD